MTLPIIAKIVAKNPVSILLTIGGIGYVSGVAGSGLLLLLGVALQFAWLAPRFL